MIIFIGVLLVLCIIAFVISKQAETSSLVARNVNFDKLQSQFLTVYYFATFSDWLQGPYVYKLYSDYGYDDKDIAVLYIVGFASSSTFGTAVGHIADKYGRKFLCASFGILYTLCCVSKLSSEFNILFIGRVFGGISTSILFSTFEAWYVNEHLNYYKLPAEWLNITFSKAAFYTGLLAIVAGIISQFLAETLQFGSVAPFLLAIPFLLISTYIVITTWNEHSPVETEYEQPPLLFSALKLIFCKDIILLQLGFIQSLYESVMYMFIFSWTPTLDVLNPPLGLVFSIFMLAFMIGTKVYTLLISKRYRPQNILTFTNAVSLICFTITAIMITSLPYFYKKNYLFSSNVDVPIYICFFSFIIYEMSIGLFFPAIGYLRGRVIPEKYRASVTNWFRVPMNIFTCFGLLLKQNYRLTIPNSSLIKKSSQDTNVFRFPILFIVCTGFLIVSTFISTIFSRKYTSKMSKTINELKVEENSMKNQNVQQHKENKKPVSIM